MIAGSASTFSKSLGWYAHHADIQFFSVEDRLAPEHRHPCLGEDCYAALMYVSKKAETPNVDPARLGVMGESACGGIVAGTALMARDRGLTPPLAKQILIYPMLYDRNLEPSEHIEDSAI
ncbi:arylesterase monooxygenase [Fusarium denticulatum]|uniref:Arylesterase monooxygenase n=1 Tax=Fusarium denticulatum TaxID=48507 RepID=A0A8H5T5M9_9HYPO|nr:arylesterase monooxygenase [Fusarium denticulatum]